MEEKWCCFLCLHVHLNKTFLESSPSTTVSQSTKQTRTTTRYWQDFHSSPDVPEKKRRLGKRFAEILAPMANDFEEIQKKTFAQLLDLEDSTMSVADELWREGDDVLILNKTALALAGAVA